MTTEKSDQKPVRIVSFLGLGNNDPPHYQYVRYQLEGYKHSKTTRHHDTATIQAYGPENITALVLLGTKATRTRWFDKNRLLEKDFEKLQLGNVPIAFVELPDGSTDQERWQIFTLVCTHLETAPLALQTECGDSFQEHTSPAEIIVDITHGWRSQPFFAASAISFMQSQQRRNISNQDANFHPIPIRLLYAAYEKRRFTSDNQEIAPVWDLSQFLDVLAWDSAIDGLMRYGRADDLNALLRLQHRQVAMAQIAAGQSVQSRLAAIGNDTKNFADGLATARVPLLLTDLSEKIASSIARTREDIQNRIPPLQTQLHNLQEWADDLYTPCPISLEGIQATLKLADIYLRTERYSELSATLRENIISAWTLLHEPGEIYQPGNARIKEQRKYHESTLARKAFNQASTHPLAQLFSSIRDIRNDIQHGGLNANPETPKTLRNNLEKQLNAQKEVLEQLVNGGAFQKIALTEHKTGFLNCSNHPINTWSQPQKQAALDLGFGKLLELDNGFPTVPPHASTVEVQELAAQLVEEICTINPAAVFIAGEFSLTYAAVTMLKQEGIRCFTSSAERVSTQTLQSDGSVQTHSVFQFAAWREYPFVEPPKPEAKQKEKEQHGSILSAKN